MCKQAIKRNHHVGRRTIVKALASANRPRGRRSTASPPRWKACMHRYIDAMITANLTITIVAIWELLTGRGPAPQRGAWPTRPAAGPAAGTLELGGIEAVGYLAPAVIGRLRRAAVPGTRATRSR